MATFNEEVNEEVNEDPVPSLKRSSSMSSLSSQASMASMVSVTAISKRSYLGKRVDLIVSVTVVAGIVLLVCALVVAFILQHEEVNSGTFPPRPSPCELSKHGFDIAIFTSPSNYASPQWVFGIALVAMFIFRKHAFEPAAAWLYEGSCTAKQAKLANYMLEVSVETVALVVTSYYGYFQLLFDPGHYAKSPSDFVSPNAAADLASGISLVFVLLIGSYTLQMAFDAEMRLELKVHHWTAILLTLWAYYAASLVHNNIYFLRNFFATGLYMITEQSVFLELLAYQAHWRWAPAYFANAAYYATTRVAICVLSLWTWWECRDVVFHSGLHNSFHVYGVFFAIPIANAVLNMTQAFTVVNLVGIAKKVAKSSKKSKWSKSAVQVVKEVQEVQKVQEDQEYQDFQVVHVYV